MLILHLFLGAAAGTGKEAVQVQNVFIVQVQNVFIVQVQNVFIVVARGGSAGVKG